MPIINTLPTGLNDDDEHYEALDIRKTKNNKNYDIP